MIKYLLTVGCLLLVGCEVSISRNEPNDASQTIGMQIVDTIGVDTGDQNFVFGDICDLSIDQHGNLLVLDAISCEASRFSPEGVYLGEFAGHGSAPGQITNPMDMTVLSDGGVAIADWDAWGIYFYDSSFVYSGFSGIMAGGSPLAITAGVDNTVIGLGLQFWTEEDLTVGEYFLSSWDGSAEEVLRFLEGEATVEQVSEEDISISYPTVFFDTSGDYYLHAALSTDSTYSISKYDSFGEEVGRINQDWEKTPLNQLSDQETRLQAQEQGDDVTDEALYANAIQGIYCDNQSNLWVRLGTAPYPLFDVYNEEYEHIAVVSIEGLSDPLFELDFVFSEERAFAWNTNPVDYPKIIVLENPVL